MLIAYSVPSGFSIFFSRLLKKIVEKMVWISLIIFKAAEKNGRKKWYAFLFFSILSVSEKTILSVPFLLQHATFRNRSPLLLLLGPPPAVQNQMLFHNR